MLRPKKLAKKKIITTSHYDLEDSSSSITGSPTTESEMGYVEDFGVESKPEKSDDTTSSSSRARHVKEDRVKYGFVATSAPAILDIESSTLAGRDNVELAGQLSETGAEKETSKSGHMFYASASRLRLNTLDLYNQVYGSNAANNNLSNASMQQAVSASELKSLQYSQTIEVGFSYKKTFILTSKFESNFFG